MVVSLNNYVLECAFNRYTLFLWLEILNFVPLLSYGGGFMADVHLVLMFQDSAVIFYPPATKIILNLYLSQWLVQTANIQY